MTNSRRLLLVAGMLLLAHQAMAQANRGLGDGDNVLIGAWLIVETTIKDSGETAVIRDPQPGLYIFTERHFSTMLVPGSESRQPGQHHRQDPECHDRSELLLTLESAWAPGRLDHLSIAAARMTNCG